MISTLSEEECPQYKVILLGQSQAGKTKLLVRYLFGSYEDSGIQTHMVDCSYVRKAGAKFAYYDTAGQEVYRVILNIYLKGTDAALLLYNMESMDSLKELGYYHKRVTEEIPNALLFVVGCKSDLPITAPIEMAKQKYRAEGYFETSAKLNTGVAELFGRV
jgi:small GTP-binding protein